MFDESLKWTVYEFNVICMCCYNISIRHLQYCTNIIVNVIGVYFNIICLGLNMPPPLTQFASKFNWQRSGEVIHCPGLAAMLI